VKGKRRTYGLPNSLRFQLLQRWLSKLRKQTTFHFSPFAFHLSLVALPPRQRLRVQMSFAETSEQTVAGTEKIADQEEGAQH
jgi:hypothetical protein